MGPQEILTDLAIIFVAAKAAGALFERFRQPAVIGELLVGVLLGSHLLGVIGHSETHELFQELGAIVLLFAVGLDTPLSELRAVGGRSLGVAASGIVVPLLVGTGLMLGYGYEVEPALFVGTAMVATSVGVTARVLAEMGRVREPESRVILGAAVVDDVLGLLVLAVVTGLATGDFTLGSILSLAALALGFVGLVGGFGRRVVARAIPLLDRVGDMGVFTVALAVCLLLSAAAGALQLAAIIGAFLAGMAFAETRQRYGLEDRLGSLYTFLVPFFFVITGAGVDLAALGGGRTLLLAGVVTLVAIATKLFGCGLAAAGMGRRSWLIVGTGMVPRGEVGILVASIGLARGVIGPALYAIVVLMSVVTTLVVPPALAYLFRDRPGGVRDIGVQRSPEIEGVGG